ncbi:MAG: hypothetical protein AB8G18_14790 [Gammaproteobacteria bacterium]
MAKYRIPSARSLTSMVEMFIPNASEATELEATDDSKLTHVALYYDKEGELAGLCCCDLPMAAGLGAALSMIPPATAQDMVKEGTLTDMADSNLYEVMNMFSSLFMDDNSAHLKLTEVLPYDDNLQKESELQSISFVLQAGGYGEGNIVFSTR